MVAEDLRQVARFGRLVRDISDDQLTYVNRAGVERLRAAVEAFRAERDAAGRRLEAILRAGLGERMVSARERQAGAAAELSESLTQLIDRFGAELQAAVVDVLLAEPDKVERITASFSRRMRLLQAAEGGQN